MNTKKRYYLLLVIGFVHLIYCDSSESEYDGPYENYNGETRHNSNNESEYILKFANKLTNYTKAVGKQLKLKCEVILSNYYTEVINSSLKYEDFQNTTDILLHKVKIRWFKNKAPMETDNRIKIKKTIANGTVSSSLRFSSLEILDKSYYSCVASIGKNRIESNGYLEVIDRMEEEDQIVPSYEPLFTKTENEPDSFSSGVTEVISGYGFTKQEILTSIQSAKEDEADDAMSKITSFNVYSKNQKSISYPSQGICQLYTGSTCAQFLTKEYVYIPYPVTQATLEEKLTMAFKVVSYSNEISSNCRRYALPSLCFSTFPICRFPNDTNALFLEHFNELYESENKIHKKSQSTSNDQDDDPVLKVHFENMPPGGLPAHLSPNNKPSRKHYIPGDRDKRHATPDIELHIDTRTKKIVSEQMRLKFDRHVQEPRRGFSVSRSSIPLRRVCREDCIIIENELCQKEYAIAKRHPEIGQKLTLEECDDLPKDSGDCLEIEIEKHISSDTCYWETGMHYRGNVSTAKSGHDCIKWSEQFIHKMENHPELSGGHNYCRNPGGKESQPWCYVAEKDNIYEQLCDIPKCSQKIWMYIICSMVGACVLFTLCIVFMCCKQRNSKSNTAAIRNINLPNADKNIYGNSRLNSPIELNELLSGQNPNSRSNGILRVPQFTLSQIKFVEELGEGAFGKVYKGELSKDNESIFVAVKALKENASHKTQQDFKREIELISELRHENIVCILGVVLREEPLCMLFEFMAKGDLHEFLMEQAPPEGSGLSPSQFLLIAKHIASGMEYLAAHHYVHRDLAARNCLVADNLIVKISDFGLSRDIYSSDYYRVQSKSLLPVRWMPPESILYGKFTTESDVWSYGVVLWEIYSYGLQPYYGYSNQEVISMVRGRQLLQCPTDCPRTVYALMRECWHQTSSKRPNFTAITHRLSGWLRPNGGLYCDMTSDSSGATSSQRAAPSIGDPRERVPLIGNHSSSNGSLVTSTTMPRKLSTAGSVRSHTSGRLMMSSSDVTSSSDNCESNTRLKKSSCGSLLETADRGAQRDTVVKIPTLSQPYDI